MASESAIEIRLVRSWDTAALVDLYRAGGWWKEHWDPGGLPALISGSFVFAVAIDPVSRRTVGMGRVISDGVSDAYIQDLVVHPDFRKKGVGKKLLETLLAHCKAADMTWISLIAEPGMEGFYLSLGFRPMKGHVPMVYQERENHS
ncbi:MAG: GNAT family N-acetyltransferase [Methanoregulaceae archaeon]